MSDPEHCWIHAIAPIANRDDRTDNPNQPCLILQAIETEHVLSRREVIKPNEANCLYRNAAPCATKSSVCSPDEQL